MTPHPEVVVSPELARQLVELASEPDALVRAEQQAQDARLSPPFSDDEGWSTFQRAVVNTWKAWDHAVIRGVPRAGDGATLLWTVAALGCRFRTYRQGRVLKHFRMSPWTTALSHTIQEGHFHTDINTDPDPPRVTAMQCVARDPGAPEHGQLRVARLRDLVQELERREDGETLAFLRSCSVTMVSDTSPRSWTGRIVDGETIRFHPETIRAAERRAGRDGYRYDEVMARMKQAALEVSRPIDLLEGDILVVSNTRALHYRSACTVRFRRFPREFDSREVYVAHLIEEPS